jgi:hypothetical protein
MHFDWGASQFLTKQFLVGAVGYVYQEVGCDSGSGDRVGCFKSRVLGVGPQVGFIIPISKTTQGYLNIKGYKEFDNANRPDGWNVWLTFVLSPAEQTPSAASRRMRSMWSKTAFRLNAGMSASTGCGHSSHRLWAASCQDQTCTAAKVSKKCADRPGTKGPRTPLIRSARTASP